MAERGELLPVLRDAGARLATRALDAITERRDPTAATQALRWTTPGAGQVADWDAEQAFRFGYLANVIAYRCVQCIVEDITALPFRAGMDPGPNPGMSTEFDTNANLAKFLGPAPGGPAPGLSARKLWAFTIAQRIVTGRQGWELELSAANIVAIWPLVSAFLKPVPTEGGAAWFSAYEYGRPDQIRTLPADRVFYAWDPDPLDFRQPVSALTACRYPLSIALMGDQYAHAFLKNGSVPAAMVVTREFANEKTRRTFRQQWAGKYTGPQNAGKTAFAEVEAGTDGDVAKSIDVKLLGLNQSDAQFLEQHQAALKLVAIDLGVPWSRLDASGRTFDNASEEATTYWGRLLYLIRSLEDEVNMGLAPRLGPEVGWFDLRGVKALQVKPEPTTAKVGVPSLLMVQQCTINEGRAEYGWPPILGGDRFLTVEEIAELQGAGQPPAGGDAAARMMEALDHLVRRQEAIDVRSAPTPDRDPADDQREPRPAAGESEGDRRVRIWSTNERQAVALERVWERAFRKLFARQADTTLSRLTGKRGRQATRATEPDPAAIFDRQFWEHATAEVADDLYRAVVEAAGVRVAEVFGIDLDLVDTNVDEFVRARANQLAGHVTDTTYAQIQDELAAGALEGEDTEALAARVRKVFEHATTERSVRIARTEVVSAFNGSTAQLGAMLGSDVVAGQEWIATSDGRTREHHAETDGQVRGIGQPFQVGGHLMAYPGDPSGGASETVNCRCTLALLTPDEFVERERAMLEDRSRRWPVAMADAALALAAGGSFDRDGLRARLRTLEAA